VINVNNLTERFDNLLYFIVSHGMNGYGAYSVDGVDLNVDLMGEREKGNSLFSNDFSQIRQYPKDKNFDDIVLSKYKDEFLSEISGGLQMSPLLCQFINSANYPNEHESCSELNVKLKTLCDYE
jgi:hypothetical protein